MVTHTIRSTPFSSPAIDAIAVEVMVWSSDPTNIAIIKAANTQFNALPLRCPYERLLFSSIASLPSGTRALLRASYVFYSTFDSYSTIV